MSKSSLGRMTILASVPYPTPNFAPIWLAEILGYGADEGLDLSVQLSGSPKASVNDLIAGNGDMTFVNVVFSLLLRDEGVPYVPFYSFVRRQNRAFSVPKDSAIRSLADLRGKTVGLHYDDPELFRFARAALIGAGVDPDREVSFKPLPGSPLDGPRMAGALKANEVQAIWQLDVLAGFLEVEGVPVRLLPAPDIDRLTPSSCLETMDEYLKTRPDAYGAVGRAIAKSTLFTIVNPEAAVRLIWKTYPQSAPRAGDDPDKALRRELAALKVRLAGQRIEGTRIPKWGAISREEMSEWQDFLLATEAIKTRRDPGIYYSDALVEQFNAFDPEPVIARAKAFQI
jgi:NitT/TauT family transport system substrate-binding protein